MDFIENFFNSTSFMPHGHCYLWRPEILWLHVGSDFVTGLAYFSIPLTMFLFVRNKPELPFPGIFMLFCAFIILCGLSHFVSIWTTWVPHYRVEGVVKFAMAIVSAFTAFKLIPVLPKAVAMPSQQILMEQLQTKNDRLEAMNGELKNFKAATLGREERVIELKNEVNELCAKLGIEMKYREDDG